jgi:hypothetical protein
MDNIKIDIQEVRWRGWIYLAQDTVKRRIFVIAVMNIRVPYNAGNFLAS